MKKFVDIKYLTDNFSVIIGVPYSQLQILLGGLSPDYCFINNGLWACDNYVIDGALISMGLYYIESKNAMTTPEMIHRYELEAIKILNDYDIPCQTCNKMRASLASDFVSECLALYKSQNSHAPPALYGICGPFPPTNPAVYPTYISSGFFDKGINRNVS